MKYSLYHSLPSTTKQRDLFHTAFPWPEGQPFTLIGKQTFSLHVSLLTKKKATITPAESSEYLPEQQCYCGGRLHYSPSQIHQIVVTDEVQSVVIDEVTLLDI